MACLAGQKGGVFSPGASGKLMGGRTLYSWCAGENVYVRTYIVQFKPGLT